MFQKLNLRLCRISQPIQLVPSHLIVQFKKQYNPVSKTGCWKHNFFLKKKAFKMFNFCNDLVSKKQMQNAKFVSFQRQIYNLNNHTTTPLSWGHFHTSFSRLLLKNFFVSRNAKEFQFKLLAKLIISRCSTSTLACVLQLSLVSQLCHIFISIDFRV